jgi:hypothetical protein
MGCGGSKSHKKEKCNMDMEKTEVQDVDSIFDAIAAPLSTLAEINNLLKKGINKIRRRTHAYLVTGCTLEDSITALLYGLSADTDGDFDKVELKVSSDAPYLKISKHKVDKEFHEAIDAWNYLIEKLEEAIVKMVDLPGQISTIVQECSSYGERAKAAIESAGLGALDALKAGKAISINLGKISKATVVLDETRKIIDEILKTVKGLQNKLDHEGRSRIHAVGKEISKAKVKNMRDIVVQYWPEKTKVDVKLERPRKSKPAAH